MKYQNKVYLSGGLESNWQAKVIQGLKSKFIFYNPAKHGLEDPIEYTEWDLYHIRMADIVFAYMEPENPSGYGLTLEIGFARALSKTVILVDEKSKVDEAFAKKFHIVRESSSVTFESLDEGLEYLKKFE